MLRSFAANLFARVLMLQLALLATMATVGASDWPQFRGPYGNGLSNATGIPGNLDEAKTVWQTAIPGTGWSSPVSADGRIWITTAETADATPEQIAKKTKDVQFAQIKTAAGNVKLRAICIDANSGEILHNILLREVEDPDLINPLNSYASPTSALVGDKVICHFGSYGTWCLNKSTGAEVWKNALVIDHSVGPGSSPVIAGNVVLIVCDGIDKQFVAGLDLESGKELWRTARPDMRATNPEFRKAYSTPLIIQVEGQLQAVIPGAQWMCGYDPQSGREIWRADCGNGFSTTPMAVYSEGLVICSTGFMAPELVAVNPAGEGDITSSNIVWRSKQGGSTMPTAVCDGGKLYSISDNGILSVLNSTNGELIKQVRIGGKFAASPLLTDGKLYLGSQEGVMTVLSSDNLSNIAKTTMNGTLMASPAVLDSDLIIRTGSTLTRYASK